MKERSAASEEQRREYDRLRHSRPREVRQVTVSVREHKRHLTVFTTHDERVEYEESVRELEAARPRTRADCENGIRPCPFVGCRHHLYLTVNEANGSIQFHFPDIEPEDMQESCALDVAEHRGMPLNVVGLHSNLTRERIRQIETRAIVMARRNTTLSDDDVKDG